MISSVPAVTKAIAKAPPPLLVEKKKKKKKIEDPATSASAARTSEPNDLELRQRDGAYPFGNGLRKRLTTIHLAIGRPWCQCCPNSSRAKQCLVILITQCLPKLSDTSRN
eukprot:155861-Amphidinium_carterae.1